jgi:hypothetical protein
MSVATISYPGVVAYKELQYTQTLGVDPDAVALKIVPQDSSIAAYGTVKITYTGQSSVELPNCSIDSARTTYNTKGFVTSIILLDRRELWKTVVPINGRYNIIRNDERDEDTEKNLRQLIELLLNACGEATPDVSRVDNNIYPEVNWYCTEPRLALSALMREWGYDVALGYGTEDVVVHELGVGDTLPTDAVMMVSSGVDATLQPKKIRVCFGPDVIQARLELEAVALDSDSVYRSLDDVSYKPANGWEKVDPALLTELKATGAESDYDLAIQSIYRVYRVKQFSDGNLKVPIENGETLDAITRIFPLDNRLLEKATTDTNSTQRKYARVYGIAMVPEETKDKGTLVESNIEDVLNVRFEIDGERGLVFFTDPMFQAKATGSGVFGDLDFKPAELYLETSFSVRDNTTHHFPGYNKDVDFDASGTGYATIQWFTQRREGIIAYGDLHIASIVNNTNNQTALDTLAAAIATASAGKYSASTAQMVVYQYPRFALRLDGVRHQISHIISDGDSEPGSHTIASAGMEFDRFTRSRHDRAVREHTLSVIDNKTTAAVLAKKGDEGND